MSRIVLASASARREELFSRLGLPFTVDAAEVDESPRPAEAPEALVARLARAKASAVAGRHEGAIVIGADTVVVAEGDVVGKPRDDGEARAILRRLAGGEHDVLTGYCVLDPAIGYERAGAERSRLRMRELTTGEIERYVASGEPEGKAGAYAIQGAAGSFLEVVSGSWTNVVGLPLGAIETALSAHPALSRESGRWTFRPG